MRISSIFVARMVLCFLVVSGVAQHPMLQRAWDAFNKAEDVTLKDSQRTPNYQLAIKLADKCINDYSFMADSMESDLEKKHVDPPVGHVPDGQKQEIFARGPLNDTAACYFIRGRSSQALAKTVKSQTDRLGQEAESAYKAGCKLQGARVWDPKDGFWNPSKDMCARLTAFTKKAP